MIDSTYYPYGANVLATTEPFWRNGGASALAQHLIEAPATEQRTHSLVQRVAHRLAVRAAALYGRWQQRRDFRRTSLALNQLDNYLLRDLGLDRSEIPSVAAGTRDNPRDRCMPTGWRTAAIFGRFVIVDQGTNAMSHVHNDSMKKNHGVARSVEQLQALPQRKTGDVQQTLKTRQNYEHK